MSQPKPLGCLDFLNFIYNGHPEYSLIAVRAPFETTIETWIEFCQQQETKQRVNPDIYASDFELEVPYKVLDCHIERYSKLAFRPGQEYEVLAPGNLVSKICDNDWTIIVRSLFGISWDELHDVPQEAQALSQILQTQTLDFLEEDTSSAMSYSFYDRGRKVERFEAGDWLYFESEIRPVPDNFEPFSEAESYGFPANLPHLYNDSIDFDASQFVNEFFTKQGIYIPACYPAWKNSTLILVESEDNEPDPTDPKQSVHEHFTEDGDRIRFRFPEMSDATLELAVEPQSENKIERADLVVIETTLADEPSDI